MKSTDINKQLMFGKLPPEAKQMEQAILGAIMLESRSFERVAAILKKTYFNKKQ